MITDATGTGGLGRIRVIRESRRPEEVNTCVEEILAGKVSARLVFDLR
ncbi:hypothetical protein [Streptomyces sp. NPDC048623]